MNHAHLFVVAALLPTLAACAPKASTGTSVGTGQAVAIVNGTPIGQDLFNFYVKGITNGKTPADLTAEQRSEVLDSLIRAELVAQQVLTKEGTYDSDTTQKLALADLQVLQQAALETKVPKPSEQELRAAYGQAIADAPKADYHTKHILSQTKTEAEKIIQRLDKGEKFEDLAKKESTDTSSKDSGGDLGWLQPNTMEPTYVSAVATLKAGSYTKEPVLTSFGWHVIALVETRAAPPPPTFESVRPRLEQALMGNKLRAYQDNLLRTAKIEKKLEATAPAAKPAATKTSTTK
jgi:peptidyl-prolyl cis-trans isomerase C